MKILASAVDSLSSPQSLEAFGWILLALSPFLAIGVARMLFNAYCASNVQDEWLERDHRLNADYLKWREWVKARGGLLPVFCSRAVGEDEVCFAYEREAHLYESLTPHLQDDADVAQTPVFDTACGVPVGEGWSILDCFEGVNFVCKGHLFVTNRNLYLRGLREIRIPLGDLRVVATSCSNFLVEASSMDRPLIFTRVNGQMLRDTIYMLLEERTGAGAHAKS